MFSAMIVSACDDLVPAGSAPSAVFIAARTSGGRSVEVRTTSCRTLSKNDGSIREVYWTGFGIRDLGFGIWDSWDSGFAIEGDSDPALWSTEPNAIRLAR